MPSVPSEESGIPGKTLLKWYKENGGKNHETHDISCSKCERYLIFLDANNNKIIKNPKSPDYRLCKACIKKGG